MREHFLVPENYFLSHSVGCLPKRAEAAIGEHFFAPWESGENWALWMGQLEEFREGLARLLKVKSDFICPQVNVSSALTKILFSLAKPEGRNVILLSKQDFPTIGFVAKQAEHLGYHLKFVDGDPSEFQYWDDALDDTVAFVLITHVLSNTSQVLPVGEICDAAWQVGAVSIVDVAQGLGVVPVDLPLWTPDFLIGTGVKFLCSGPGASFLYVAEHMLQKCQPLNVGWFSHENPFEMNIDNFRYATDAMRFFGGTPSPASYVLGNAALQLWTEVGLENAQAHVQGLLSTLHNCLPEEAVVSPSQPDKRGATFVVNQAFGDLIRTDLLSQNIRFDQRKQGYRFSVHGYTSEDEVAHLAEVLNEAAK